MQIGITFEYPWVLALFPVLVAFILITGRNLRLGSSLKKRTVLGFRLALLFVLVLALSAPAMRWKANQTATIFLADVSDSTKHSRKEVEAFIHEAMSHASNRDRVGVISFAKEARVLQMPKDNTGFSTLESRFGSEGTDIAKALTLARSIMPENAAKRLVLLSDGKQTTGDALDTARLLKRFGYTVDVMPINNDDGPEVQIEAFSAPKQVNAKERFDISVRMNSNIHTKATVRLFANRTLTAEKEVECYPGQNLFTFSDEVDQGGMVTYSAEVVTDNDTVFQNNQLSAFTQILDMPRILLIERGNSGENLVRYIEAYAQVTRVQPTEVPTSLAGMLSYDAFILVDINMDWMHQDFFTHLEQAVSHQGKGLLTIGGENSYAPGGYNDTILETILPVEMDIRPKEENPDLGLLLVIDKSGSMSSGEYGISKLELAKEAAIRAAEVLEESDQLGVIAFDDAIQWVIQTEPLTDMKDATDRIGSIRPGGGTQILHPLEAAWQDLRNKDTKLKHIILLTDGQAEQYGYERVIEGIRDDGITLSTVAVGQGADTLLLKALAYGGQGRYYRTDEFSDIPSIFAKEAFLAGQKYLQNRHFYPELVSSAGILKGIQAVPPLDGYVATRIKSTARTVFRSDIEDPVLAVWQYGLGRTAAWTSDIQGIWTSQWALWQDAPGFWGNLAGWLVQKNLNTGYTVETKVQDGKGRITVSADTELILYEEAIDGTMVTPEGTQKSIRLNAVKPGVFEGEIDQTTPGAYVVNLQMPGENQTENISAGIVMPYAQEYRILDENALDLPEKLASAGGGRVVTDAAEIFSGKVQNTGSRRELTNFLILVALILLIADIAMRKLQIPMEPIVLFFKEKVVEPVKGFLEEMLHRRKTAATSADTTRTGQSIVTAKGETDNREDAKEVDSAYTQSSAEKDKGSRKKHPIRHEKNAEGKAEKQQEGSREHDDSKDHVQALLNRRKQWK